MHTNKYSRERDAHSPGTHYLPPTRPSSPTATKTDQKAVGKADAARGDTTPRAGDTTFPLKLFDAIEQETTLAEGTLVAAGDRVFAWLPGGHAFVIRCKARFEREVLAKYFNKCKFMSFTRKLYRWGFRQSDKGSQGSTTFQHKHFVRGDRQLCLKMRSLVKAPPVRPPPLPRGPVGYNLPPPVADSFSRRYQLGLAMATDQHNQAMGNNAMSMAPCPLPQAHAPRLHVGERGGMLNSPCLIPPQAPPPLIQMGGGNILPQAHPQLLQLGTREGLLNSSDIIGLAAGRLPSVLPEPGHQFSRAEEILATRLCLERLEQSRQQLMYLISAPPATALSFRQPVPLPPSRVTAPTANYGTSRHEQMNRSEVELVAEILRQGGAGTEPWRALELVKRLHRR